LRHLDQYPSGRVPLYKGAVLLFLKCLAGALAVWAAGTLFGPSGFLGISTLALIACLTSSNSSLYIALCSNYGDASDAGAISVFCIKDGPFVTMMVLGSAAWPIFLSPRCCRC
jgi:2-keto-3-deoxygluconate permease